MAQTSEAKQSSPSGQGAGMLVLVAVMAGVAAYGGAYSGAKKGGGAPPKATVAPVATAGVPVKVEVVPSVLTLHSSSTPPEKLTLSIGTQGVASTITVSWDIDVFEETSPVTFEIPAGVAGSYTLTVKSGASGTVTLKTTTLNSAGVTLTDTDVIAIVYP